MEDEEKKTLKGKIKDAEFYKNDNYANFDELLEYMPAYADKVISVWQKLNSDDYKQQISEEDFNKDILTNNDYSVIFRCYRLNKMGFCFETDAKDWILKQNEKKQEKIYENMRQCYDKSLLFKAQQEKEIEEKDYECEEWEEEEDDEKEQNKNVINTNSIKQSKGKGIK